MKALGNLVRSTDATLNLGRRPVTPSSRHLASRITKYDGGQLVMSAVVFKPNGAFISGLCPRTLCSQLIYELGGLSFVSTSGTSVPCPPPVPKYVRTKLARPSLAHRPYSSHAGV
jgi:hypothetical protein